MDYDLVIIGDEREGVDQAIFAAKAGRRVMMIKPNEPVVRLEFMSLAASRIVARSQVTMAAWQSELSKLACHRELADQIELESLGIDQTVGDARFLSQNSVEIQNGDAYQVVCGKEFLLACGTRSWIPPHLPKDLPNVIGFESIPVQAAIPRSCIVVGTESITLNVGLMLSRLGVETTVLDERNSFFEFYGALGTSFDSIQNQNLAFRMGEEVIGAEEYSGDQVAVKLASGRKLIADTVVVCAGRQGRTGGLNLDGIGVGVDERGRVWGGRTGETWVKSIRAVGDVVGFSQNIPKRTASNVRPPYFPLSNRDREPKGRSRTPIHA